MTKNQVADMLQVCERTIENMVKSKTFPPPLYLGKTARWAKSSVASWLTEQLRPQMEWQPRGRAKRLAPAPKG